jgi:hypothetical protein
MCECDELVEQAFKLVFYTDVMESIPENANDYQHRITGTLSSTRTSGGRKEMPLSCSIEDWNEAAASGGATTSSRMNSFPLSRFPTLPNVAPEVKPPSWFNRSFA